MSCLSASYWALRCGVCYISVRWRQALIILSVMGVCLPSILSSTGNKRYMPIAIFHGLCLEISVPMLVTFFCSVNL